MAASKKNNRSKAKTSTKSSQPKSSKTDTGFDLESLEQIAHFLKKHELAEIEWEKGSQKIRLRSPEAFQGPALAPAVHQATATLPPPQVLAPAIVERPIEKPSNLKEITSPFVGTFYRSPSPESAPYVSEGQAVKPGDVLCIVEAMKLMNEIEADFGGRITDVLKENGQPVEFGEPLFMVET